MIIEELRNIEVMMI